MKCEAEGAGGTVSLNSSSGSLKDFELLSSRKEPNVGVCDPEGTDKCEHHERHSSLVRHCSFPSNSSGDSLTLPCHYVCVFTASQHTRACVASARLSDELRFASLPVRTAGDIKSYGVQLVQLALDTAGAKIQWFGTTSTSIPWK